LRSAVSIATGPLPVISAVAGRKDKAQTPVDPDEELVEEELTLELPVVELLCPDEELPLEEPLEPWVDREPRLDPVPVEPSLPLVPPILPDEAETMEEIVGRAVPPVELCGPKPPPVDETLVPHNPMPQLRSLKSGGGVKHALRKNK
jgi:hypothetical protein